MPDTIDHDKAIREANDAIVEGLTENIDERSELQKHILVALSAGGVQMNCQTADIADFSRAGYASADSLVYGR